MTRHKMKPAAIRGLYHDTAINTPQDDLHPHHPHLAVWDRHLAHGLRIEDQSLIGQHQLAMVGAKPRFKKIGLCPNQRIARFQLVHLAMLLIPRCLTNSPERQV